MVTMHDVLDAQWMYDNTRDGKDIPLFFTTEPTYSIYPQNHIFGALSDLLRLCWSVTSVLS